MARRVPSSIFLPLLMCAIVFCIVQADHDRANWCTISSNEQEKCEEMRAKFEEFSLVPAIACIQSTSTDNCISKIASGAADLITLDGGDVFSGGKQNNILPIMEEVYADGMTGYNAVAVVKKSNEDIAINTLTNGYTCHTGYGRTAGWNIPVGFLLEEGIMPSVGCRSSLESASMYFNQSCVPGAKAAAAPGVNVDNLCSLCKDPDTCSRSDDLYAGYAGAFRCLVEAGGDVAFIKPETVFANTNGNNVETWASELLSSDFEILCRDGSRQAITASDNCHLAVSPSHAVVTSFTKSKAHIDSYVDLLTEAVKLFGLDGNANGFDMFASGKWSTVDLLFKDVTKDLKVVEVANYEEFLGSEYMDSLDGILSCPAESLRLCTISDGEQAKCLAMREAFSGASINPDLSCFQTESHFQCIEYIAGGNADIVTLDGSDIYTAGKDEGLVPVMGETYGSGDASYWAVAVVKASSSFNINGLEGKKSCHTGIMKTSGWVVPVGYLVENNEINVVDCDTAKAVGEYFSESCAPGALSEKYDPYGTNPNSLCQLCIGEDEYYCVRNDHEPFYDYSGAFRCLVEGQGDVAFIKHLTVGDNTDGSGKASWNMNLKSEDYQYLCPDGSKQTTWSEECSLSKVSSHAVVTSGTKTVNQINTILSVLNSGQQRFSSDDGTDFKMFDSGNYAGSDLIFKDSTRSLLEVGNKNTYDTWLTEEYIKGLEAQTDCIPGRGSALQVSVIALAVALFVAQALQGGD